MASIPPRSAPDEYTKFFVDNAISRVETQGLDATLAYYNREESVDSQRYVFIIDENDLVIGHPGAHRLGLDLKGWVGTDANGYNFGPNILSATEDGKWVSYVYRNPESGGIGADHTGALEYKHVWAVQHDGLLFASGWQVSADEYTKFVVDEAIARYHELGLEAALEYYNDPASIDAQWYVFIASPDGELLGHYNAGELGVHLEEMFADGSFQATEEGVWVTHEDVHPATGKVDDKHFWLVEHDGLAFGSGTNTLVFGYTVKPSDKDDNGLTISNGGIDNDGKLYGLPGDALIIAVDNAKERNPWYSGQTNVSGHKVDRRPYVENVSIISTPAADDTYTAGETIQVELDFDQEVDVEGTPRMHLGLYNQETGSLLQRMSYTSGTGTDRVVFSYLVGINDLARDGVSVRMSGGDFKIIDGTFKPRTPMWNTTPISSAFWLTPSTRWTERPAGLSSPA